MLWLNWGLNNFLMGLLFLKSWKFVCLHRSFSILPQSHKFRSRCPTLTRSRKIFEGWSRSPTKMRTVHPWSAHSQIIRLDTLTVHIHQDTSSHATHHRLRNPSYMKGKEEYSYSAFIQRLVSKRSDMNYSFTCKLHHACLSFVIVHQMAPPLNVVANI